MLRELKYIVLMAWLALAGDSAHGFALLGPLDGKPWTVEAIGYSRDGDIGDPVLIGEEYRWNTPTIVYAYDSSFLNYFGQQGVEAIETVIKVFNDLPRASAMNLDDFPTDNKRENDTAERLGIMDIKSFAMSHILELLGLAQAERWVWGLRGRDTESVGGVTFTNYAVIQQNFDPETWEKSARVNNALYMYQVVEPIAPDDYADAIEFPGGDPFDFYFTSVSGGRGFLFPGQFFPGLTRDDAGGLRYLLRRRNYNVEGLVNNTFPLPRFLTPGTGGGGGGGGGGGTNVGTNIFGPLPPWLPIFSGTNALFPTVFFNTNVFPWAPFTPFILTNITITNVPGTNVGGTNVVSTNRIPNTNIVTIALRPGIEKITFVRRNFDSLLGQAFRPYTNRYTDIVISNFTVFRQNVERVANQPDLLFGVEDLGLDAGLSPFLTARGNNFVNNDAINGNTDLAGPGVITGPMRILFTDILPVYFESTGPGFGFPVGPDIFDPNDPLGFLFFPALVWGSFDETTTPPVVFPNGFSIEELEERVEGGGNP